MPLHDGGGQKLIGSGLVAELPALETDIAEAGLGDRCLKWAKRGLGRAPTPVSGQGVCPYNSGTTQGRPTASCRWYCIQV